MVFTDFVPWISRSWKNRLFLTSLILNQQFPSLLSSASIILLFATNSGGMESEPSPSSTFSLQGSQSCRHFEFLEIQLATDNFDESLVIWSGGFGKVYKLIFSMNQV